MEKQAQFQRDGAARHLGIITQRCYHWYQRLPVNAKLAYDLEDMIQEVVLHVCARAAKYDASKGQESTWVYRVSENCCREIISRFRCASRYARELVELSALGLEEASSHLSSQSFLRQRIAFSAVERLIASAVEAGLYPVVDLIELLLAGEVRYQQELSPQARAAIPVLRKLATACQCSSADFIQVFRNV